jgi:hypothetical protein
MSYITSYLSVQARYVAMFMLHNGYIGFVDITLSVWL